MSYIRIYPSISIYELIDPETNESRYIGKTKNIQRRFKEHCYCGSKKHKTRVNNWIKSLNKKDLKPILNIIDEVNEDGWKFWEMWWIELYKGWGINLYNHTNGGEGTRGIKWTEESRRKSKHPRIDNSKLIYSWLSKNKNKVFSSVACAQEEFSKSYPLTKSSIENFRRVFKLHKRFSKSIIIKTQRRTQSVLQYTLDKVFIKEWKSSQQAEEYYNIKSHLISCCCIGKIGSVKGYIWKYKGKSIDNFIKPKQRLVYQYDLHNNLIKKWNSVKEVAEFFKLNKVSLGERLRKYEYLKVELNNILTINNYTNELLQNISK